MKYLCVFHQAKALKDNRYASAAMQQSLQLGSFALERCDLHLARRCFGSAFEIALLHINTPSDNKSVSPRQLKNCLTQLSQVLYMLGEVAEIEKSIGIAQEKLKQLKGSDDCNEHIKQEVEIVSQQLQFELGNFYSLQPRRDTALM